jgi:hypothetical protein
VLDEATAAWLKEAYISYRMVLHHLSLEGDGERVVAAAPYTPTRDRLREIWRATFESVAPEAAGEQNRGSPDAGQTKPSRP